MLVHYKEMSLRPAGVKDLNRLVAFSAKSDCVVGFETFGGESKSAIVVPLA